MDEPSFYLSLPGVETQQSFLYLSGNPPEPTRAILWCTAAVGLTLLIVVWIGQRALERYATGASRRWRVSIRVGLVALFFLTWELAVGLYAVRQPYQVYVPDPHGLWRLHPELEAQFFQGGAPEPVAGEENGGRTRVLFLGDSQLLWVPPGKTRYTEVLQQWADRAGARLQFFNGGVAGYSSFQGMLYLQDRLLERVRPHVVVACFGYHDSNAVFSPDEDVLTDSRMLAVIRQVLYSSRLYLVVRQVVMRHTPAAWFEEGRPLYPRVSVERFDANLKAMAEACRQRGARFVVVTEPLRCVEARMTRVEAYYARARGQGPSDGTRVVDAAGTFGRAREDFDDDVHFTVAGHRRMAEILARALWPEVLPDSPGNAPDRH